jgi:tetratricopeptide (TPR) repeat protein
VTLRTFVVFPLALLLLAACSSAPQLRDTSGQAFELRNFPYFSQDGQQGAPAALAMLLTGSGAPVTPAELVPLLQDAQAGEVSPAAVRSLPPRYGRVAYTLRSQQPELDLVRQVQAGHAVLVLLRNGMVLKQSRYALLIGVNPAARIFVLRGAGELRREIPYEELFGAWKDGGRWAMLALRPGEVQEDANAAEWLSAAAQMEQRGRIEAAAQAYIAVTQRWPGEAQAWLGAGRSYYHLHNLRGATIAYNNAVRLMPGSAAAHNGLAQALVERQCADQAEDEARLALELERDPRVRADYFRTQRQVQDYSGPSVVCPLE